MAAQKLSIDIKKQNMVQWLLICWSSRRCMFDSHNKHGGSKPAVTPVGGKSAPSLASYEHQPVKRDIRMCIAKHTYALKEDKQKS